MQLLDYQMRELEKYRTAVHRMGQDILSLRQQVRATRTTYVYMYMYYMS